MKKLNLLFIAVLITQILSAQIEWDDNFEVISEDDGLESIYQKIVIDEDNNLHVVWQDGGGNNLVKYITKPQCGEWTVPITLNNEERNCHTPHITIGPNNNIHVIHGRWAYENAQDELEYTFFNGTSWSTPTVIAPGGNQSTGAIKTMIFDSNNNPIAIWGSDNRTGINEVYKMKFDGEEWEEPQIISEPADNNEAKSPISVKIDNQKYAIFFLERNNSNVRKMKFKFYDIQQNTWSEISQAPDFAGEIDNVAQYDIQYFNNKIYVVVSYINNVELWEYDINETDWKNLANITPGYTCCVIPRLTVDNYGLLHVFFNDNEATIKHYMYQPYNDQFSAVDEKIPVNNPWYPEAICDAQNNVNIVYYDNDYANENEEVHYVFGEYLKPYEPEIIHPTENQEYVATTGTILEWQNAGDDVVYDLYFGKINELELIETDYNLTNYELTENLQDDKNYQWRVVAKHEYAATPGILHNFFTGEQTSVNKINNSGIQIYPNPSNGTFSINQQAPARPCCVIITDITGKTIHKSEFASPNSQFVINKKGIYFIKIEIGNKIFIEKIIIQ